MQNVILTKEGSVLLSSQKPRSLVPRDDIFYFYKCACVQKITTFIPELKASTKYLAVFIIVIFVLFPVDVEAQCAMCKAAAETSMKNNPKSMARSLNSGILYLMAVPYLMLCFIFRKQIAQIYRKIFRKTSGETQ
ncbi:MAG: rane protein [Bacteroidota bacterium]|nr:rane protein [Bacteroidota bacterium]